MQLAVTAQEFVWRIQVGARVMARERGLARVKQEILQQAQLASQLTQHRADALPKAELALRLALAAEEQLPQLTLQPAQAALTQAVALQQATVQCAAILTMDAQRQVQ